MEIKVERAKTLKEKPDQSNLGFGKYFTDHMFVYDWDSEKGWHDARIVPYASDGSSYNGPSLCTGNF